MQNLLQTIIFGVAVGDALGVPVEFESRASLKANPVTSMRSYGTYDQPSGTWSDDTSMTICLAESIIEGFSLQNLADKFVAWKYDNYWTPHGEVFDIGIATSSAITRLKKGEQPEYAGGFEEEDNGNGSLMRILPLVILTKDLDIEERYNLVKKVSSLTHGHIRSVMACFYYLEFAKQIIEGKNPNEAYTNLQETVSSFFTNKEINSDEVSLFDRLLKENISSLEENDIESSGYVMHTLEASIWCILTSNSYEESVLKAVNLGEDTDTTGAVAGGLAAITFGMDSIPKEWLKRISRKNDIKQLVLLSSK
jgi:ADP-ribosyl-[dinitrogen reductase] hydrolase